MSAAQIIDTLSQYFLFLVDKDNRKINFIKKEKAIL